MKWYEFIVTYWAQIFAISGLLVGAFKIWLDYRNKRLEIKHNLFFKEKMNYILAFYSAYFEVASILRDYLGRATFKLVSSADLDKDVYPKQQSFRAAYRHLELLLSEDELEPFKNILGHINAAERELFDYNYRNRQDDDNLKEKLTNPLYYIESNHIDVNDQYFKVIAKNTRTFYGMKP